MDANASHSVAAWLAPTQDELNVFESMVWGMVGAILTVISLALMGRCRERGIRRQLRGANGIVVVPGVIRSTHVHSTDRSQLHGRNVDARAHDPKNPKWFDFEVAYEFEGRRADGSGFRVYKGCEKMSSKHAVRRSQGDPIDRPELQLRKGDSVEVRHIVRVQPTHRPLMWFALWSMSIRAP